MSKHAYRVAEAARLSSLSRSKLYELMQAGCLPYTKVGRCRLIRHADLMKLLGSGGASVG